MYAPFTDLLGAEVGAGAGLWQFSSHPKDAVVINLGTNDVNPIRFYSDLGAAGEEELWFSPSGTAPFWSRCGA